MLLTPIPWANRIWALPFITVLAPSKRYHDEKGKKHKKLSDWTRQICFLLARWLTDFQMVMIAYGPNALLKLFAETRRHVAWITRLRMNASLYDFPPPYQKDNKAGLRKKDQGNHL